MKTLINFLIVNVFILSAAIFSSCEQITGPTESTTTDKTTNVTLNKTKPERPFKGDIFYVLQTNVPDANGNLYAYGTGNLTHLGKCTTEEIIHFLTHSGEDTFTAADGSTIHLIWELSGDHFTWEIDGGTGRFDGATGSGISPLVNPGMTYTIEYIGVISY